MSYITNTLPLVITVFIIDYVFPPIYERSAPKITLRTLSMEIIILEILKKHPHH